jgi:phosphoribosyl-AMP cyclohydrolase
VFLDREALQKTVETRELYRFSRKLNRLIKKGEESGNTQRVISLQLDCDSDCLKVVVE